MAIVTCFSSYGNIVENDVSLASTKKGAHDIIDKLLGDDTEAFPITTFH